MADSSDSEMLEEIIVDSSRRPNPKKRPATPPVENSLSLTPLGGSEDWTPPTLSPSSPSPDPIPWRPAPLEALKGKSSREHIILARDILLQASLTEENQEEKLRILDLIEIFRDYTEKKRLNSALKILASQISDLERVVKNLKTTRNPPQTQHQPPPSTPKPKTFAQAASNATPTPTSTQTWQTVGKKGKTTTAATSTIPPATTSKEKHREKRLILV